MKSCASCITKLFTVYMFIVFGASMITLSEYWDCVSESTPQYHQGLQRPSLESNGRNL